MSSVSEWVFGTLAAIAGLLGLILAAHAVDAVIHGAGLMLFGFAILFNFWLIKSAFDNAQASAGA